MEEVQGQAPQAQPSVFEQALAYTKSNITGNDKPRDETGKFAPKNPEAPKPEAATQEEAPKAEEEQATEVSQEESPQPEIRKHKLKVKTDEGSDEEIEVDEEELKRGYMKSADYSRKTAQLAREREAVQAKVREAVEPKLREYDDRLSVAQQLIEMSLAHDPQSLDPAFMRELSKNNPAEYVERKARLEEAQSKLGLIYQERQKIAAQTEEESQKALQKSIREAHETLSTKVPGWSKELYGKILETGKKYGFKAEEVGAITDPRAIEILNDARQWREFKSKPPEKVKADVPKVVKPGTAEKPAEKDPSKDAMDRLKKTGKRDDAVAAMLAMVRAENKQK